MEHRRRVHFCIFSALQNAIIDGVLIKGITTTASWCKTGAYALSVPLFILLPSIALMLFAESQSIIFLIPAKQPESIYSNNMLICQSYHLGHSSGIVTHRTRWQLWWNQCRQIQTTNVCILGRQNNPSNKSSKWTNRGRMPSSVHAFENNCT